MRPHRHEDPHPYSGKASGMHPTGMNSCLPQIIGCICITLLQSHLHFDFCQNFQPYPESFSLSVLKFVN